MNRKNKRYKAFALFSLSLFLIFQSQAKNYYVKTNGIAVINAASWSWASPDLQATIDKASSGDFIYVATGKYYGGFIMKEGVNVMGGYTTNNNNPTERYSMSETDSSHYSFLNGENKQRVLTLLIPITLPTTWDGFIFQNGNSKAAFKKGSIIYSQTGVNEIIGVLYQFQTETGKGIMIGTSEISKHWGAYKTYMNELQADTDSSYAKLNITGLENTEIIINKLAQNPVDFSTSNYSSNGNYTAFWCDTLTTGGNTEWYLPAPGELQEVYNANKQNILRNIGKDLRFPYWTSSQIGSILAWSFCFGNGNFHPALKYITHTVSPLHQFNASEQTNGIYFAGGSIFLLANGIVQSSIISNNTSTSTGGDAYVGKNGQLINCILQRNNATEGNDVYYEVPLSATKTVVPSFNIYSNLVNRGSMININNYGLNTCNYAVINISGQIIAKGFSNEGKLLAPFHKGIYILYSQEKKFNRKNSSSTSFYTNV